MAARGVAVLAVWLLVRPAALAARVWITAAAVVERRALLMVEPGRFTAAAVAAALAQIKAREPQA
jgi:hypothetical protein